MTKEISLRILGPQDAALAADLEKECFADPWSESVYHATLLLPYAVYFGAFTPEGKLAGTVGVQKIGGDGEISNVAVRPDYRRQGIAESLMELALKEVSLQGVRDFTLEVREGNLAARALYERFGFVTEGVRRNFYDHPTEDALIMWRRDLEPNA